MRQTRNATTFPVRLVAAALIGGGALLLIGARTPPPSPVYSLAAVRAGLGRSPVGWVGRSIRVRALVGMPCVRVMGAGNQVCISWRPSLVDSAASSTEAALPLLDATQRVPRPPLLAALRQLPLARLLVGSPPQLQWGALATYRVLLQAAPTTDCGAARCYQALLLDAAPGSL